MASRGGSSGSAGGASGGGGGRGAQALIDELAELVHNRVQAIQASNPHAPHLDYLLSIRALLAALEEEEASLTPPFDGWDFNALEAWLEEEGMDLSGLPVSFAPGLAEGAGVVARRDLAKGDLAVAVPAALTMSTTTALECPELGTLVADDPILRAVPSLTLALHLLLEKNAPEGSQWGPYIASLPPRRALHVPLLFDSEALQALEGMSVVMDVYRTFVDFIRQFLHCRRWLQYHGVHSPWFTWEEFSWAAAVVMSRQNALPVECPVYGRSALSLVPLFDLFNHEPGEISSFYDVPSSAMEVHAKRDFKVGEQVYMSYGARGNDKLLLFSGFVTPGNAHDTVRIPPPPPPLDEPPRLAKLRGNLLRFSSPAGLSDRELVKNPPPLCVDARGRPSPALAAWATAEALTDEAELTAAIRAAIERRTKGAAGAADEGAAGEGGELPAEAAALLLGLVRRQEGMLGSGGEGGEGAAPRVAIAVRARGEERRVLAQAAAHLQALAAGSKKA